MDQRYGINIGHVMERRSSGLRPRATRNSTSFKSHLEQCRRMKLTNFQICHAAGKLSRFGMSEVFPSRSAALILYAA